ncbi:hypothetical protein CEUSTIGMA_g9208.t1 [Chlamydomonas eustigma]|uniref:Cathepsin propeptide inhibitor domain-containing protein n=1 Tax=Chlamydomonas eustigma TaxID=1157962 RepID=A0A250XG64_9CHLO|nr:hypothetical protein CEUSTIGMA_g9208.t1 [Chlamydomonas eustigma]|eukprot:GAX81780.1 hypothetical protein CEUSTIGMA_g9208.t1 [Chlamydomonas eustigma]
MPSLLIRFLFCLLCLLITASGALYDRQRGMKTYNLPDEHVQRYLQQHSANTIVGKQKQREALKEHPDVQQFLSWRERHQAGDADAGVAFTGKIPHDFLHMMTMDHASSTEDEVPEL